MHGGGPEGAMAGHQCVDIAHVSWGCACVAWVAPAACELASLTHAIALQGQVTTGVRSLDRHHVGSEEHRHLDRRTIIIYLGQQGHQRVKSPDVHYWESSPAFGAAC